METLLKDIRYGLRSLLKHPGFTCIAVLTLALGIGANTAIFSVVNAVLLRELPFREPDRLVMVWEDASFAGFPRNTPAPANYADWKAQNQVFEDMATFDDRSFNLTGDGEPEKVQAYGVTANFFGLLGIKPVLGRAILPELELWRLESSDLQISSLRSEINSGQWRSALADGNWAIKN